MKKTVQILLLISIASSLTANQITVKERDKKTTSRKIEDLGNWRVRSTQYMDKVNDRNQEAHDDDATRCIRATRDVVSIAGTLIAVGLSIAAFIIKAVN